VETRLARGKRSLMTVAALTIVQTHAVGIERILHGGAAGSVFQQARVDLLHAPGGGLPRKIRAYKIMGGICHAPAKVRIENQLA